MQIYQHEHNSRNLNISNKYYPAEMINGHDSDSENSTFGNGNG